MMWADTILRGIAASRATVRRRVAAVRSVCWPGFAGECSGAWRGCRRTRCVSEEGKEWGPLHHGRLPVFVLSSVHTSLLTHSHTPLIGFSSLPIGVWWSPWVFGLMEVWVLLTAPVAPTFILSRALKPVWSLYVLLVDSDTLCPLSSHFSDTVCSVQTRLFWLLCSVKYGLVPPWRLSFKLDTLQQGA